MKKNGFTLIELLAVIVILAIIALIATPIILGIIKDTKEEADQRSVEMYAKAIQNAITQYQMKENINPTKKEDIKEYIKLDEKNIDCEVKINEDGSIYVYNCIKDNKNIDYEYGKLPTYDNGEIVYFDVVKGEGCSKEDYEISLDPVTGDYLNSSTEYNGLNGAENQNSCLKFYAFNDAGSKKLNLLLDHNTTATIEWVNKEDFDSAGGIVTDSLKQNDGNCQFNNICVGNNVGPMTLLKQLYQDTKLWSDKLEILDDYTLNQKNLPSQASYTIEYSKPIEGESKPYKARLITLKEIVEITEAHKLFDIEEENLLHFYFFNDLSQDYLTGHGSVCASTGCKYGWLYDRTTNCKDNGCLNNSDLSTAGYWTSSAHVYVPNKSHSVTCIGLLDITNVNASSLGIRPVIEVLKSSLK